MPNNPNLLFQYRSNKTALKIIKENTLRLSDIRKSNDSMEMKMFFPDIFPAILSAYQEDPFDIKYEDTVNEYAIMRLNKITFDIINSSYFDGSFSNLVACFSENDDQLSQWRAYGDDGRGCSLGYSIEGLNKIVSDSNGVLFLTKVIYVDEPQRINVINSFAHKVINNLVTAKNIFGGSLICETSNNSRMLGYWYWICVKYALSISLGYKHIGFQEENEWRIILSDQAYKNPSFVLEKYRKSNFNGPTAFLDACDYLKDKYDFNITEDNLIPFISIPLTEYSDCVKSIRLGPKNHVSNDDLNLYLANHNLSTINVQRSIIPYC